MIDDEIPRPLDPDEEDVVRAIVRAILVLPRLLDADLVRDQRLALHEYAVLMHVSEAPRYRLRMSDLAGRCELSLSGTTRIVARLEADGLLKRVSVEQDARGTNAVLTYRGLKRLQQAWPTHLASVRRHIVDHLTGLDLPRLVLALQQLGTQAGAPASRPVPAGPVVIDPVVIDPVVIDVDRAAAAAPADSTGTGAAGPP